jgi:ketosteroid isomerase-like protein
MFALALPHLGSAAMTRSETIDFAKTVVHCWQVNDSQTFAKAFADDAVFIYPGGKLTKPELLQMFTSYQKEKSKIRIYTGRFVVDGDKFAFQYQFAATDNVTKKRQAVGTGVSVVIRNGQVVLWKEYYDESIAELQAAGKLPLDEGDTTPYPSSVRIKPELIN